MQNQENGTNPDFEKESCEINTGSDTPECMYKEYVKEMEMKKPELENHDSASSTLPQKKYYRGILRKLKHFLLGSAAAILLLSFACWFVVTQPLLLIKEKGSIVKADPTRLEKHVRMLSETLCPRDYAHLDNLNLAADYIQGEFQQTSGRVSSQPFTASGKDYHNVLVQFGPDTRERIVIGAHYDAFGAFPGADDNASGVAGLIELAHLLDKTSLSTMVELVAYSLEEPPFFGTSQMGSAIHANSLKKQDIPVRLMISIEMIGCFKDSVNSQHYPLNLLKFIYPSRGNFIVIIGKLDSGAEVRLVKKAMHQTTSLPVYSFNAPPDMVQGIDWSDHLNYWNNGYPAVMVTDSSYLRNGNYHTKNDTTGTLDYKRMSQVVEGIYETVIELAKDS